MVYHTFGPTRAWSEAAAMIINRGGGFCFLIVLISATAADVVLSSAGRCPAMPGRRRSSKSGKNVKSGFCLIVFGGLVYCCLYGFLIKNVRTKIWLLLGFPKRNNRWAANGFTNSAIMNDKVYKTTVNTIPDSKLFQTERVCRPAGRSRCLRLFWQRWNKPT